MTTQQAKNLKNLLTSETIEFLWAEIVGLKLCDSTGKWSQHLGDPCLIVDETGKVMLEVPTSEIAKNLSASANSHTAHMVSTLGNPREGTNTHPVQFHTNKDEFETLRNN